MRTFYWPNRGDVLCDHCFQMVCIRRISLFLRVSFELIFEPTAVSKWLVIFWKYFFHKKNLLVHLKKLHYVPKILDHINFVQTIKKCSKIKPYEAFEF